MFVLCKQCYTKIFNIIHLCNLAPLYKFTSFAIWLIERKNIHLFKMTLNITIYTKGKDIPDLPGNDIFHSKKLFLIYEATPKHIPYMIVVTDENQEIISYMMATVNKHNLLIPPFFINRCIVYGKGVYPHSKYVKEYLFGQMLHVFTQKVQKNAFVMEFKNLGNALCGYKYFRENNYFPVNWLRVINSLHSQESVNERISPSRVRQITQRLKNGATIEEITSSEEIQELAKLLHKVYATHVRKHFPNVVFFNHMEKYLIKDGEAKIFAVKYKGKIIGGSACIYSNDNAYLWFSGGMRKSYALQYPGVLAVWAALKDAYESGYKHLEFVDVGLPFKKHGYRDFVLRFGGKQSSTRRWFRFRWNWLNKFFIKIYV